MNVAPSGAAVQADGWVLYSDTPVRNRTCGSCKMCCTLVPVETDQWDKAAGERCRHVCRKGCAIYPTRPSPCVYWSCRWLFDEHTAAIRRPDRAGYVIDPQQDTILIDGKPVTVVQVWVDPARPGAHRDQDLRLYLDDIGRRFGMLAIIRLGNREGIVLCPPCLSATGTWEERWSVASDRHEFLRALGEAKS